MKNKKIILAGGTGFIGEGIINYFGKDNQFFVLTRHQQDAPNNRNRYHISLKEYASNIQYIHWDGQTPGNWCSVLEGADLLINLAGRSVNCRYTKQNKKEILESRLLPVHALNTAIALCKNPPEIWINASSATVYRHAEDRPQDEYSGEYHEGFSVDVCQQWEETFFQPSNPLTRKVALRMAITLGPGGVLIPYFNLLKFGLGGKQGSGNQYFSWIHIEDSCRMIEWITAHKGINGVVNCCAPAPVTNQQLMQVLRELTGNKFGLPAPAWLLKVGAAFMGTETELVLKSRWVIPTRIQETGFVFKYPYIQDALKDILQKVPRRQYRLV